jgi:hypothetical protein
MRSPARACAAALAGLALCLAPGPGARAGVGPATYGQAGDQAVSTLLHVFYAGNGRWRECDDPACATSNQDWGVDSLTYALHLRWSITHDSALVPALRQLAAAAPTYGGPCLREPCGSWSDVPEWDAVAILDEYDATGRDPAVLAKALAAFHSVEDSVDFALGACPGIRFQQPFGGGGGLKTLETDANAVKAALLLHQATGDPGYLRVAATRYAAIRRFFYDRAAGLYTVYVFDDGRRCRQLPHRFFASVNGDMIWNGLELSRAEHDPRYLADAMTTAHAAATKLSDPAGVFADLQAENDVVEPLVEAMYRLATEEHAAFARRWLLANAGAALSARAPSGAYGRFFDGPPPTTTTTAWQSNGGLALAIAAAALDPRGRPPAANAWAGAGIVPHEVAATPSSLTFTGRAIALLGTLGERCCQAGHVRILVDGAETFDRTGIWQDKSSLGRPIPNTILFAWRWPTSGRHTIRFEPAAQNPKEGGTFVHVQGYRLLG